MSTQQECFENDTSSSFSDHIVMGPQVFSPPDPMNPWWVPNLDDEAWRVHADLYDTPRQAVGTVSQGYDGYGFYCVSAIANLTSSQSVSPTAPVMEHPRSHDMIRKDIAFEGVLGSDDPSRALEDLPEEVGSPGTELEFAL